MPRLRRHLALLACVASAAGVLVVTFVGAAAQTPTVGLSSLDGRSTPTSFTLVVDVPGGTSAKLVLDGVYVGEDAQAPLSFPISVPAGEHRAKVRTVVGGSEVRADAVFVAGTVPASGTPATTAAPAPTPSAPATTRPPTSTTPSPTTPGSTTPTTGAAPSGSPTTQPPAAAPDGGGGGSSPGAKVTPVPLPAPQDGVTVLDTVAEIRTALATGKPGDVFQVADGQYQFKPRLVASASGTPSAPITLRGSRAAVLRTKNASGDYGLHVTGDHWRIRGVTVAHATKGIVLDGSVGTVIDGVEVFDIGDEAIHFRACSSDGVLRNSFVHHTGRNSPQYGEGVYVGSANSNWSQYQCTDAVERQTVGDNSERVLIEDNVFEDITAEGADLKEGTDSGTLRRNVFRRTGTSGMNSADSAVDAKGNGWVIEDNVVSDTGAPWDDDGVSRPSKFAEGFQSHSVYDGYGTRNVFRRNKVVGTIPGYGFGLYPQLANVVTCDNSAPGAAKGLVGNNSKPSTCKG